MLDMNRKETFSCAKPLEWRKLSCQHGAVAHFYMIRMSLTFHSDDYNQHISSTVIFFFFYPVQSHDQQSRRLVQNMLTFINDLPSIYYDINILFLMEC